MVMVRSAIKKIRRKSQREAARLQRQADAVRAMEEEEEIHFKQPDNVPNTPRVSRSNTPDPEDGDDRGARDYTAVLEMVKTVRDRLTALVLDNTNIRAACDDLRRCNRLRCPLARMSGLHCFNMGHNGHGINLYGVSMTLMEN